MRAVFFFLCFLPLSVFACDLCAVFQAVETDSGRKGSLQVGVQHQFTHFDSELRPSGYETFAGQHLESNITQFFGSYRVSSDVAVQLSVPVINRDYRRINKGLEETGSERGLGDIPLIFRYTPYRKHGKSSATYFELFAGAELPNGDSDRLEEERVSFSERSLRHGGGTSLVGGDDLALGNGSTDVLMGFFLFHQVDRFFVSGTVQYSLRTEGDYDYEFGDDLQWRVGPGYFLTLEDEMSVSARVNLSGEYKDDDKILGQALENSDINDIFLGPELRYILGNDWSFRLRFDFPIKTASSSEEVIARYRLQLGATYQFS